MLNDKLAKVVDYFSTMRKEPTFRDIEKTIGTGLGSYAVLRISSAGITAVTGDSSIENVVNTWSPFISGSLASGTLRQSENPLLSICAAYACAFIISAYTSIISSYPDIFNLGPIETLIRTHDEAKIIPYANNYNYIEQSGKLFVMLLAGLAIPVKRLLK